MSRVYEALKNAQDQRAAQVGMDGEAMPPESAGNEAGVHGRAARRIPEILSAVRTDLAGQRPEASSVQAESAPPNRPVKFEELIQRCAKPSWKPKAQWTVFSSERPAVREAEQFRTLRAHLHDLRETRRLNTLLVTSSTVGEGKTFVSLNLAQAIARQRGRRVLLVDADLRSPKLHVALGAPSAPGLSDYLAGDADECSIAQAGQDDFFFIPAGRPCCDPAELLANNQLQNLFSRLGSLFDWVIVDAPPLLPVSDAGVLAGMCDGVIFIVRAGMVGFDKAQSACAELKQRNLLGVVLNGVEEQAIHGGYGYY